METQPVKRIRIIKRFFYLHDYEINYSNGKDLIMIKNYETGQFYEFSLSGFILRYHSHLQQDKDIPTTMSNHMIEAFSLAIKKGKIKCDFSINNNDDNLWLSITNGITEYHYDISTHFLVMCCNDENYEWFSLLHNKVIEYHDSKFALNKLPFELLQSWIYISLKVIFHDTKG
jgi:hypothetical protein